MLIYDVFLKNSYYHIGNENAETSFSICIRVRSYRHSQHKTIREIPTSDGLALAYLTLLLENQSTTEQY